MCASIGSDFLCEHDHVPAGIFHADLDEEAAATYTQRISARSVVLAAAGRQSLSITTSIVGRLAPCSSTETEMASVGH